MLPLPLGSGLHSLALYGPYNTAEPGTESNEGLEIARTKKDMTLGEGVVHPSPLYGSHSTCIVGFAPVYQDISSYCELKIVYLNPIEPVS